MAIARVEFSTVLLLLFALVACAKQPMTKTSNEAVPEADRMGSASPKATEADPQAAGETCGDVACVSSTDCCKGYACGFDPERSRVQRYCLGP